MKNWTNRSWLARRLCAASLALLAVAMPAHAFQKTTLADGGFEYFFAASSLDIRGAGDLDLTGLSFIEGVTGGFRVGASFDLDWLGGENASLASPASTWSGVETSSRTLSIIGGGNLRLGTGHLALPGGSITLEAGTILIGNGGMIDVGGGTISVGTGTTSIGSGTISIGGGTISIGGDLDIRGGSTIGSDSSLIAVGGNLDIRGGSTINPGGSVISVGGGEIFVGGGSISVVGGQDIFLPPGSIVALSPVPEPGSAAMLLAGLLALAGVAARRANAAGWVPQCCQRCTTKKLT